VGVGVGGGGEDCVMTPLGWIAYARVRHRSLPPSSPACRRGPWQYRFYVPHDPKGLAALYAASGRQMCDVLQSAQTMPGTFHIGAYGTEIHEMTEMVSA
jgi:hypothetical protein